MAAAQPRRGNPLGHDAILERVGRETQPTLVWNCARRFGQQQTAPGSLGTMRRPRAWRVSVVKSPSGSYPRSESLKPFLPASARGSARIATSLRKHRFDVIAKAPGERLIHVDDATPSLGGGLCRPIFAISVDFTICQAASIALFDRHDLWVAR